MAEQSVMATGSLLPVPGTKVSICEAWLRDGIQGWPLQIETADKVRMLGAIAAAGVPELDVTSFVSKRLVPQFFDGEVVLAAAADLVRTRVLTVTPDGARRVVEAHRTVGRIDRCGMPFSVSEAHNLANLRRNHAEHREHLTAMFDILTTGGVAPLLGVVTAFGCPIQGRVDPDQALVIADWGVSQGVKSIMFGDTTGMANPQSVAQVFLAARAAWPDIELIAHFHDNRGCGLVNTLTAIACGASTVDSCLGGVGGEPKGIEQNVVGDQGNTCSEDLVAMLSEMQMETGIDPAALLAAGALAEEILGRKLFSRVQRSSLAAVVGGQEA
jgi:hydroxymethylglutaryl-CoA lyase